VKKLAARTSQAHSLELEKTISLGPRHRESAGDRMLHVIHSNGSTVPGTPHNRLTNGIDYLLVGLLYCLAAARAPKEVSHSNSSCGQRKQNPTTVSTIAQYMKKIASPKGPKVHESYMLPQNHHPSSYMGTKST